MNLIKKIIVIIYGILFSLVILEIVIRLGGFISLSLQEYKNKVSISRNGTYKIMCLGESTTLRQYPGPLEEILNKRNIGVKFSVIDKGIIGINTFAILSQLKQNLDIYKPDMVIMMAGCNDGGIRYYKDIPAATTGIFQHCKAYRFMRIIYMHIVRKLKEQGMHGSVKVNPKRSAMPPDLMTCYEKIESPFNKAIDSSPKNDNAYIELGRLYRNQGKSSQAEDAFKKALELDPKNDRAYVGLGWFYRDQGKFPQAENLLKKAIELNPKNDRAHVELGWLYREQGRLPQAEDAFKKAVEFNPKNDNAYIGLGRLYREQGRSPQAEDSFKKALELDPKNDRAHVELGRLYRDQGKSSQAEDAFKKALELDPKNDRAHVELGWFYRDQGKFPQAEDAFKKALELNPKIDSLYFELGKFYLDQGKFSQAEGLLKKAIELNPRSDRPYGAISVLYEEIGKPELAKEYSKKVNRLRLDYAPVTVSNYRKLKEILDKRGIRLVCVQYPMRNVEPLKRIFEKNEGVIFVNNESVFKEALKKASYKDYFRDMFGGDFGHCTEKGNRLLAQNIADTILRDI